MGIYFNAGAKVKVYWRGPVTKSRQNSVDGTVFVVKKNLLSFSLPKFNSMPKTKPRDFNFVFSFGIGEVKNKLDTFKGQFTKDMTKKLSN